MTFAVGDKVKAVWTDALGNKSVIDGEIAEQHGDYWRVRTPMGIAILFKPEDLQLAVSS